MSRTPESKREEAIFEIVNQPNRGSHLLTSVEHREHVAELNFLAGRRAVWHRTGLRPALQISWSRPGIADGRGWVRNYSLIFSTEYLMAECELLTADKVAAENRLSLLPQRANNRHDFLCSDAFAADAVHYFGSSDLAADVFLTGFAAAARCGRTTRPRKT